MMLLKLDSMASKLVNPASQVGHPVPRTRKMLKTHSRPVPAIIHPWTRRRKIADGVRPIHTIKVAEQSPGLVDDNKEINENDKDNREVEQIKADLYQAVQVMNRGIFGVPSAKKSAILGLVELLESQNPTTDPTLNLEKVGGCWKLVYSTITILGSKRTKLGLRDFITLGDFFQYIDVAKGKAVNVINFNVRGLNLLSGQLTIEASFKTASKSRVDINYESSTIIPDQVNLNLLSNEIYAAFANISKLRSVIVVLQLQTIVFLQNISFRTATQIDPECFSNFKISLFCCVEKLRQLMNLFRKNYDLLLSIFNPDGWLEITYVDDNMRIGRDDSGNIFILERSQESET
ncbi:hypothetical protein POTOM_002385 [Populus tomentosa]|uniref:Plastid lipid-associated protein/fibrillin conserved domain-containing protein n=1 Tax=Populus tomentosa TaxID=118781 RepID=A0A8X8DJT4_POPTO|nr:hypothetical protein POTOM_002385 [Populus tomentosa]